MEDELVELVCEVDSAWFETELAELSLGEDASVFWEAELTGELSGGTASAKTWAEGKQNTKAMDSIDSDAAIFLILLWNVCFIILVLPLYEQIMESFIYELVEF